MIEFIVKCPVIVCTQTVARSHVVTNMLRNPVLSGPLESGIEKVWDMSEILTENKLYFFPKKTIKDFLCILGPHVLFLNRILLKKVKIKIILD